MSLVFVGEAWGAYEEAGVHPFCGTSGVLLFEMLCDAEILERSPADSENIKDFWYFWRLAQTGAAPDPRPMKRLWADHPEVTLLNVFNLRPENNNIETLFTSRTLGVTSLPGFKGKFLKPEFLPQVTGLMAQLDVLRSNLTVCLGGTATWAILRNSAITKIRGAVARSFVGNLKCLPTFHPAAVLRQPEIRPITVMDLIKAKRESTFPEIRRPMRKIFIPETIDDLYFIRREWVNGPNPCSVDIETANDQITCIGFGQSPQLIYTIPFIKNGASYWPSLIEERVAWQTINILADSENPKVFQNGLYDLNRCWAQYRIVFRNVKHDTMLAHHSLFPESPKGLDFQGSYMTDEPAWKLMRKHKDFKKED